MSGGPALGSVGPARLADSAIGAGRREEAAAGVDPTSQKELRTERAIASRGPTCAAREAGEAKAATEAARLAPRQPGERLPAAAVQAAALARVRAEQETIIREIEVSESAKP